MSVWVAEWLRREAKRCGDPKISAELLAEARRVESKISNEKEPK